MAVEHVYRLKEVGFRLPKPISVSIGSGVNYKQGNVRYDHKRARCVVISVPIAIKISIYKELIYVSY